VPAAAVIPAPIAYIKVVAVKKLVVGFRATPTNDTNSYTMLLGWTMLLMLRQLDLIIENYNNNFG